MTIFFFLGHLNFFWWKFANFFKIFLQLYFSPFESKKNAMMASFHFVCLLLLFFCQNLREGGIHCLNSLAINFFFMCEFILRIEQQFQFFFHCVAFPPGIFEVYVLCQDTILPHLLCTNWITFLFL